jgi:hypothetical protein
MTAEQRPTPLVVAAVVVVVEAAGLLGYAVVTSVQALRGDRSTALGAALLAVLLVAWGAGLLVAARGLWRVRRWARSPVIVSELLLLAVGIPLIQGAGRWVGVLIVAGAVTALGAALSPSVTAALVD